ncbi:L,D-transpeptidase [Methylocystis sp. WRRC1]|uniref:L,D-transpeptidase n=1 Tax=Methylocystis sp. WRRC1 TaxID=1732014 RepID=UPI00351D9D36
MKWLYALCAPRIRYRRRSAKTWSVLILASLIAGAVIFPDIGRAREIVGFSPSASAGAIIIKVRERALFFVVGDGVAIRYRIAVPKRGKEWAGAAHVSGKYINPDWSPPPCVKADHPELPDIIPGGAPGNPMGARAITLDRLHIAIHGTSRKMRRSIGTAASYRCIRMLNEDVIDLFDRVRIGAPVLMIP